MNKVGLDNFTLNPPKSRTHRSPTVDKIYKFIKAFFYTVFAIAFMFIEAPFFWAGFLVGVVLKDQMKKMVERIISLWLAKPILTTIAIVAASLAAFPIVICATAFFYGADLAVKFVDYSQKPTKKSAAATAA